MGRDPSNDVCPRYVFDGPPGDPFRHLSRKVPQTLLPEREGPQSRLSDSVDIVGSLTGARAWGDRTGLVGSRR